MPQVRRRVRPRRRGAIVIAWLLAVGGIVAAFGGPATGEVGGAAPGTPRARAAALDAGSIHTCAVLDNGQVKCWGDNGAGQLGQGNTESEGDEVGEMDDSLPAIDLGAGRTATAVSAGSIHSCALLDNATLKCWGDNSSGQLGLGDMNARGEAAGEMGDSLPPIALGGPTVRAVSAGGGHTCALLADATVKCWGANGSGQLGLGDMNARGDAMGEMGDALPAVDLGAGRTALAIAAGSNHTCALLDNATVKCWGDNTVGGLGQGDMNARGDAMGEMGAALPAVMLGGGRTALAVTGGSTHTCVGLDNGSVKCWGGNNAGQLGLGDVNPRGDAMGEMGDALLAVMLGTGRSLRAGVAPPAPPTGLTITPGNGLLKASWTAPTDNGGAAVVDYLVQFSADGITWATHPDPVSAATTATITGLTNGTPYSVRVAARNSAGLGPFSAPASGTPDATVAAATGYLLVEEDGDLFGFGPARDLLKQLDASAQDNDARQTTTSSLLKAQVGNAKVLDIVPTRDGQGFWALLDNGVILNRGTAPAYPAVSTSVLTKQVRVQFGSDVREPEKLTAMSALSDDTLWVFSTAGRIIPVGTTLNADTVNDMNAVLALDLHGPMVGSTATLTGAGAYSTATDGGIFTYGDAVFIDSVRGQILKRDGVPNFPDQPVTDVVPDPDGSGYYVAAIDGGVFAIQAPFVGSLPAIVPFEDLFAPVNGMVTFGNGYLLIAGDGGVFNFSNQPFAGSASLLADTPIIAIAPTT